jgi:hypothetical protein
MNNKLKNFIQDVLVPEGYSMSFADTTVAQMETLIEIATDAKEELESAENSLQDDDDKDRMEFLLLKLKKLIESDLEWSEKYSKCWVIKKHMFKVSAFSWDDPDCGYDYDVYAFYSAAKRHIREM